MTETHVRQEISYPAVLTPPVHPFLWALFPILSLLEANMRLMPPRYSVRGLLLVPLITGTLVFIFGRKLGLKRASILLSIWIIGLSSSKHAMTPLATSVRSINPVQVALLGLLLVPSILLLLSTLVPRSGQTLDHLTLLLNLTALVAVAIPASSVVRYELYGRQRERPKAVHPLEEGIHCPNCSMPSIYYLVLDGYGSGPILEQFYNFDNSDFISQLRRRGFFVGANSTANYAQTTLSLASSLNMQHLTGLKEELGKSSQDHEFLPLLIRENRVRTMTESLGYRWIALATGYRRTELRDVHQFITFNPASLNPFEARLLESSYLGFLFELQSRSNWTWPKRPGYSYHRASVRSSFEAIAHVAKEPGPKFVFAHVISPHPPFVFDDEGNPRNPSFAYDAADGDQFPGTKAEYVSGYRQQVAFINKSVLRLIDAILHAEDSKAIVILQSDHGPGAHLAWDSPSAQALEERAGILYAIYGPEQLLAATYPGISPVNTYRIVANAIFDQDKAILPDTFYYSSWRYPYDFQKIELPVDSQP